VAVAVLALVLSGGGGGGDDDDGGNGSGAASTAAAIPAGNVISNPSFEQDTKGWGADLAKLSREEASDAPDGTHVVSVTLTAPSGDYSIDDNPDTISNSVAGRDYTASAWVKGTELTHGDKVCISIRERPQDDDGGDFPHSEAAVTVSAFKYRQVKVTHPAEQDDMRIDVHLFHLGGGSKGDSFLADAIALTENGAAASGAPGC
jgi:hypothetical protein